LPELAIVRRACQWADRGVDPNEAFVRASHEFGKLTPREGETGTNRRGATFRWVSLVFAIVALIGWVVGLAVRDQTDSNQIQHSVQRFVCDELKSGSSSMLRPAIDEDCPTFRSDPAVAAFLAK